jgi:hypothetical protein
MLGRGLSRLVTKRLSVLLWWQQRRQAECKCRGTSVIQQGLGQGPGQYSRVDSAAGRETFC